MAAGTYPNLFAWNICLVMSSVYNVDRVRKLTGYITPQYGREQAAAT